jgi:PKD repeat protein
VTPTPEPTASTCNGDTYCLWDSAAFSGLGLLTISNPGGTDVTNSLIAGTSSFPACPSGAGEYTYHMNILWSGCYICDSTCSSPTQTSTPTPTGTSNETATPTPTSTHPPITFPTTGIPENVPVADFTANSTSGTVPLTVQFNDTSSHNPTAWKWNFSDGNYATEQNPLHTYTTAGTYDVTLTASNADGGNTSVKEGFVVVTASTALQATDVAGRSMHQSEIEDVANKQQLMNYNSLALFKPNSDIIKTRLPNDTIFVFTGHGAPGYILLSDTYPCSGYSAMNASDGYNFEDTCPSYSNLKLAVFFACNTGNTDPLIGNLVDVVISKGAGCAIGWTGPILSDGSYSYNSGFWTALQNGESIQQAHLDGLNASKYDLFCQSLKSPQEDPDKYQYCLFEHVYQQGSSCSQPLPSGIATQMVQNLNLETSLKTSVQSQSQLQSELILGKQAIRKFSNLSEIDPEYEKTIHYSYGDLDTFATNNITYIVNRNTGRVMYQNTKKVEPESENTVLSTNQGLPIAEMYAKEKCSEFWQNKSNMVIKNISQTARTHELTYHWRQYFKINTSANRSQEIAGFNKIDVTLDARDGAVISYNEWYIPVDRDLDFTPALSEEQAWERIKENFNNTGLGPIDANHRKNLGLVLAIDDDNSQHLAWQFEIEQDNSNQNYYGGQVIIDAHNGQIVRHIRFG